MQINKSATEYLDRIGKNLQFIQDHYLFKADSNENQIVQKFQRVYRYIDESYRNKYLSEEDLFSVYGFFLQTVKKFKRKLENKIYYEKTDYEATLEKLERNQVKLVPVYKELILEAQKLQRMDLQTLLDANMIHHIYTKKELGQFALQLLDFLNLDSIKVPRELLSDLINEIVMNYNVVPYHNFTHAFQLSQLLFSCYMKSDLKKFCNQLEIFSAILAGLGHDLNHKGVNNMYKIKKSKKFNILTSEIAVLENMHCATFFNIIQLNKKHDFFQYMANDEEKNMAKRLIITSILATDMSKHAKLLTRFQKRVECTRQFEQGEKNDLIEMQRFSNERLEDRIFILNIMVHACDISNPTMKFENYMNWSYLLTQEFNDQTIKEAQIGVDVTGFLIYKDKPSYYGGQIFFASNILQQIRNTCITLVVPNRGNVCRSQVLTRRNQQEFRNIIVKTQIIMIFINKILAKFCTANPIQQFNTKLQSTQYGPLCEYMNKHNKSVGIKSMSKTIFALQRELQAEQSNHEQLSKVTEEIKKFLQKKKYNIRTYRKITQLYKDVEDQQFAITIFPRNKQQREYIKKKLAYHELDKFDEHFTYTKLDAIELSMKILIKLEYDEEERRQEIIDSRLDQMNPLGLEMFAELPVLTYITIQPNNFDQVYCISMIIGSGNVEFREMAIFDELNLQKEWNEKTLDILEEFAVCFKTDVINLSDPLQKGIVKYLTGFGLEAQDAYYFELLSIMSEYSNYLTWMKDLHNKLHENLIHA